MIVIDPNAADLKRQVETIGRSLAGLKARHIPYAVRTFVNRLADQVHAAEIATMDRFEGGPEAWTRRGLYVKRARANDPAAAVYFKDFAPKGVPAGRYLRPQIDGGQRRRKASERRVGSYLVPAGPLPRNRHGNVRAGLMTQMLAGIGGLGNIGANSRRLAASYFFGRPRQGGSLAIWKRTRYRLVPMLYAVQSAPTYAPRYDFHGIAQSTIRSRLPIEAAAAVQHVLSTARP